MANNTAIPPNAPLVSIVIPVYNVEQFLPQCLDSVVNQTYRNIEVICVNDGSPDNSLAILRGYASRDGRIRVLNTDNQGLSAARNTGTEHAGGAYLLYVDSDDWLSTDCVEVAIRHMLARQCDVALWGYEKAYDDHSVRVGLFTEVSVFEGDEFRQLHSRLVGLTGDELRHPERCDSLSTAWGKMYRTDIIQTNKIRFVDTKIIGTEDLLFNAEYFNHCRSAVGLPDCFSHYRKINSTSLTHTYKSTLFTQWTELQTRLKTVCEAKYYLRHAYQNRIALSTIGLGLNEVSAAHSLITKHKNLNAILNTERYKKAYRQLEIQEMPVHWRLFFFSARHRLTVLLMTLLYAIRLLR